METAAMLSEQLANLCAAAVDAESLSRAALEALVPALGADAGEITLPPADGIAPRLARHGDPPRFSAPSVLALTLSARGAVIAELALWATRPSAFDATTERRLKIATAALGPTLAMLRLDPARESNRLAFELRALHRIADIGARSLDLDEVLGSSLDLALDVTGASMGVLCLRDDARATYRSVFVRNMARGSYLEEFPCTVVDGFFAQVEYLERTPQQLVQLGIPREILERAMEHGVARLLFLPLRREQRIVGLLSLQLRATEHFEPTTLHTLRAITRHVAVYIENARAHRAVARRERLASLLRDFAEKVVSPIEPGELYRLVLPTVQEIMRCNGALLSRIDDNKRVRVIAGLGRDEGLIGFEVPTSETSFLDDAATQPGVFVVEDTTPLAPDDIVGRMTRERRTRSFALLTMRQKGRPIGHLFAGSDEPRRWDREEIEAMELLGTMAAEVLERERLSAVAEAERRVLDATIEDLPIVLAVVDTEGRALHVNRAGRMLNPAFSMGGAPINWQEVMPRVEIRLPDGTPLAAEQRPLPRAFRGEVVLPTEIVMTTPDGITANVLAFAVPISRDASGRVIAVATGYQDVSALRALADEKDRFLRVASHELRSPLTSLRATTSLLELDPTAVSDPERRATMLQRIRRQVDRLVKLVEQLIDSARVRAELPLEPKECDLVEVAREAIDLAVTANGDPTRRVALRGPSSLRGRWDPLRIEQALTNLVANALRYSPPAAEVEVTLASTDGERVRVAVVDRGIGIPADQIDSVFGPFFRAKNAVAAHRGGLGLGLYITSEIVRRHGGTISVESQPNVRTSFVIDLPREVQ